MHRTHQRLTLVADIDFVGTHQAAGMGAWLCLCAPAHQQVPLGNCAPSARAGGICSICKTCCCSPPHSPAPAQPEAAPCIQHSQTWRMQHKMSVELRVPACTLKGGQDTPSATLLQLPYFHLIGIALAGVGAAVPLLLDSERPCNGMEALHTYVCCDRKPSVAHLGLKRPNRPKRLLVGLPPCFDLNLP